MRVLVTGSAGFVGTWLCRDLAAHGHEAIGSAGRFDVRDRDAVGRSIDDLRPEAIVHLAAVSTRAAAQDDPARAIETNVGGTIHLLEAVRRQATPPVVLVAGTGDVYAAAADPPRALAEDAPLAPTGTYALSKAGQEAVALAARSQHGLPTVVVRAFNHSGPGQRPPLVLPSFVERVRAVASGATSTIPVGDIDVARDFLDVRDVVAAYRGLIELAARDVERVPALLNVASGSALRLRDLLDHLVRLAGVEATVETRPELTRPGEPRIMRGDPTRLTAAIGWRPMRDPFTMVTDMWEAAETGGPS